MSDWGQGAKNNNIGWGQGAVNNNISWGAVHENSWAGDTNIVGFAYDADYQAILDYATTQGYTLPSEPQRLKQNTLLIALKDAGVWSKLDTFANFATDGSTQFALIDWKRLVQYNASTGPTFTTNEGFMGNGTSSYIDTNFNPASGTNNYTLNNASRYLFMYMASGTGPLDGVITAGLNNMTRTSTSNHRINSALGLTGGTFDFNATRGMKSIHRTSSTNVTLFNDNTASAPQRTSLSTSIRSENQFILKSGATLHGAHEVSMYAMGANLISENADFVTAYNTYITSL
jgi:hypothetical protein